MQVLYALRDTDKTLTESMGEVHLFPQKLINVKVPKTFDFQTNYSVQAKQQEANQDLDGDGRVLLRASGTEPVVRVMVEGKDEDKVGYWAEQIAGVVKSAAV